MSKSCWNYRIAKKIFSYKEKFSGKNEDLAKHEDINIYSIVEAYYPSISAADNYLADSFCERNPLDGYESLEDLKQSFDLIKLAFEKPILDLDELEKNYRKEKKKKEDSQFIFTKLIGKLGDEIYVKDSSPLGGYTAYFNDFPGIIAQGDTIDLAQKNLWNATYDIISYVFNKNK